MAETEQPSSSRIFISYRRDDAVGFVRALRSSLRERFTGDHVFKDTDNIQPGQDFVKAIQDELNSCRVLLAVIGSKWATIEDKKTHTRRLENPNDYLRLEIATALKNEHMLVIPVLVDRAPMPTSEDLPEDLEPLARRNAIELSDIRWDTDIERLVNAIENHCKEPLPPPKKPVDTTPPEPVKPAEPPPVESRNSSRSGSAGFELLEAKRKRLIAEHVKGARQAFEKQDFETVIAACDRALWLDPQQPEARDLATRARAALDEVKIQEWLAQAAAALAKGDLAAASEAIDEALACSPNHAAAVKLRQDLLRARQDRERQREVERLVAGELRSAQSSFDEEDFEVALNHVDDALALAPESREALELRGRIVAARDEQRRLRELKRRAQLVVADARAAFADGKHEAALSRLEQFTPPHELVTRALEDLRRQAEEAKEAARVAKAKQEAAEAAARTRRDSDATLAKAAVLFQSKSYAAAKELVDGVRALDPTHPDVAEWADKIRDAIAAEAAAVEREKAEQAKREEAARLAAATAAAEKARREKEEREEEARREAAARLAAAAAAERAEREKEAQAKREKEDQAKREEAARLAAATAAAEKARREKDEQAQRDEAARLAAAAAAAERAEREKDAQATREKEERAKREETARVAAAAAAAEKARREKEEQAKRDEAARLAAAAAAAEKAEREKEAQAKREKEEQAKREAAARLAAATAAAEKTKREKEEQTKREEAARLAAAAAAEKAEREKDAQAKRDDASRIAREEQVARADRDRRAREFEQQERERVKLRQQEEERERQRLQQIATQSAAPDADASALEQSIVVEPPVAVSTSKSQVVPLAAAALLVVLIAGGWWALGRKPAVQEDQAPAQPPPSSVVTSTPAAPAPPPAPDTPTATPDVATPPVVPTPGNTKPNDGANTAAAKQLEGFRTQARAEQTAGRREPALAAVAAGLKIDPKDSTLLGVLDSLARDAQSASDRAKQTARTAGATPAEANFNQGLQKEAEAAKLRDSNNKEDATRSFWSAEDSFTQSAAARAKQNVADQTRQAEVARQAELARQKQLADQAAAEKRRADEDASRQRAADEAAAQKKREADLRAQNERQRQAGPTDDEKIRRLLNEYTAAFERKDFDAIASLHPTVARQLAATLKTTRSYAMTIADPKITINGNTAVVSCTIATRIRPNVGNTMNNSQTATLQLQKTGDTWMIVDRK